jgi:FtsP/CotA-like multicopper oxidase with cupredoxin domain
MDGDLAHFLKGSGFYVLATTDSTEDDHPKRSRIVELNLGPGEGHAKQLTLTAERKKVRVVPDNALRPGGLEYNAIVLVGSLPSEENLILNDSIPGPVVGVNQNDLLEVTVNNNTGQIISLIFSGLGPDGSTGNIGPGESKSVTFRCTKPGLFPYYGAGDALLGIWEHVWSGMYGAIVVRPENEPPAKEFCVIFSELYSSEIKGLFQ